jgi:hypothetical protein
MMLNGLKLLAIAEELRDTREETTETDSLEIEVGKDSSTSFTYPFLFNDWSLMKRDTCRRLWLQ